MNKNIPLIVDLDHTLIDTDLLVESSIATLKCVKLMRGSGKNNLRACFFALINIVNGSLVVG
jgi:hypothetical protein